MQRLLFVTLLNYFTLQSESSLRIYRGRDAARGEFPYVVRIEEHTTIFLNGQIKREIDQRCTGATLTTSWILSAAHCVEEDDFNNKNKKLFARYNSYFPKIMGNIKIIFEAKMYPTYYYPENEFVNVFEDIFKNDICLFRSEGVLVSSYGKLSPVDYRSLIGHEAYTVGFGSNNVSEYQKPLQVLKGMLFDCHKEDHSKSQMLCLAQQCGLRTTICAGDSGGPVVHSSGIVGVNSESEEDCDVYSKRLNISFGTATSEFATVSPNFDWISNIVANKSVY